MLAAGCLAVAATASWSIFAKRVNSAASSVGDVTASIEKSSLKLGPSGLPLPRFVSLKAEKVNVRRGPSSDYPVVWVFQRKGMPVEIVAEFENWRRVRDSDGAEGWILQNMLSGKRMAMAAPRRGGQTVTLYAAPSRDSDLVVRLAAGVVGEIEKCTTDWCEVSAGGYDGFVEQASLWGVYPGESVD
jgi:SH3-like domain-containing protein